MRLLSGRSAAEKAPGPPGHILAVFACLSWIGKSWYSSDAGGRSRAELVTRSLDSTGCSGGLPPRKLSVLFRVCLEVWRGVGVPGVECPEKFWCGRGLLRYVQLVDGGASAVETTRVATKGASGSGYRPLGYMSQCAEGSAGGTLGPRRCPWRGGIASVEPIRTRYLIDKEILEGS